NRFWNISRQVVVTLFVEQRLQPRGTELPTLTRPTQHSLQRQLITAPSYIVQTLLQTFYQVQSIFAGNELEPVTREFFYQVIRGSSDVQVSRRKLCRLHKCGECKPHFGGEQFKGLAAGKERLH